MENLIELLKSGGINADIEDILLQEPLTKDELVKKIIEGKIAVLHNHKHKLPKGGVRAVGEGLTTKINANIGTSTDFFDIEAEIQKMKVAVSAGADAVMDLSTGGDLRKTRKAILSQCPVPLGTVPVYQAACDTLALGKGINDMDPELMFDILEEQAEEGVDFMTIHCGITIQTVEVLKQYKRLAGIVSRGGAFMAQWILSNNSENPFYAQFDRLLDILKKHNVVLSLGDGLRPGCIADASDTAQFSELYVLGELTKAAWHKGVSVIIEGPGHVPLHQIKENMRLEKSVCAGAPFYVLGPLVTDVAPGYDHITSAIGGAVAASYGADFLCYVTPSEHLGLPTLDDVKQGVIACKISAHAGDIAKGIPGSMEWDNKISRARKKLDWGLQEKLSIDPEKFRSVRSRIELKERDVCSMCGRFCSMREMNKAFELKEAEIKK